MKLLRIAKGAFRWTFDMLKYIKLRFFWYQIC